MKKSDTSLAKMDRDSIFPRVNNLEWLRLIFALQVVITHTVSHVDPSLTLPALISNFPGVPAFFFVSGFLIYSSYLNAPGWRYFENRFLRLFPALVVVTLSGCGIILIALGWNSFLNSYEIFIFWFVSQITFGQAYNPELFRTVGVGVINGSLWTITVELIFYLLVPILVFLQRRFRFALVVLIFTSLLIYTNGSYWMNWIIYRNKSAFDLLELTPIVWGWMFGFGILAVDHFHQIKRLLIFAPILLIPMVMMAVGGDGFLFAASGNRLGLFYFICYAAMILWVAFWLPAIRLPFDFSYGAYIWHMPIINLLLVFDFSNFPLAIAATIVAAALSWFLVEKPMLKLKRQSLRLV